MSKSKEQNRKDQRAHRLRLRAFINNAKDRPCVDCGHSFPVECMDFDHVRGKKSFNLAHVVRQIKSYAAIEIEIMKCDVVCANCHRIRTRKMQGAKAAA